MRTTYKFLFALVLLSATTVTEAHAALKGAPFIPEADSRFDQLERGLGFASGAIPATALAGSIPESKLSSPASDGLNVMRLARASYDVVASGGAAGAHAMGVTLPAKAVIKQVYWITDTQFAGATGTVALGCAGGTGAEFLAATDLTGQAAGTIHAGIQTGVAGTMSKITASCPLQLTVATATQTAGKMALFVEYSIDN